MSTSIVISNWKPVQKNSLLGFFSAQMPSGMIMNEISVHSSNGKLWASPPSKPMVGRDGIALKDENGKVKYSPLIAFSDKSVRDKWSDAVVRALQAAVPGVG
jgi:hypothetical protein